MTMEEKNELQNLIEKKWNWLRKHIGKNIIDFFQKTDPKKEEEEIELILEEANAYGLRWEVKETAEKKLEKASREGHWLPKLEAYVQAYNEWIK
jgi:hypothetical protein